MVEKLEPPEDVNHLRGRFYWLKSPKGDLFPALWKPYAWWLVLGQNRDLESHRLAAKGWTYSHPANPNAITLDPEDEGLVETGTRAIAALDGCTGEDHPEVCGKDECCLCRKQSRAVIAEIMKGRGG